MLFNKDFANSTDGLFLLEVTANERFLSLDLNQAFARHMGAPRKELVGAYLEDAMPKGLATPVLVLCRRCLEAGMVVEETVHLDLPQGRQAFHAILIPLRDAKGDIRRILGIVNVRDPDQEAPGPGLPLVNLALSQVRESVFLITEAAEFVFVNDAACRALGYERAELLGLTVADIDPDIPQTRWPRLWQELAAQGSLEFESRHRTKDGRIFPVEIHANIFAFGDRIYVVALACDISERQGAINTLRESEEKYRTLFEESFDGLFITSPRGRILDINRKGIALFGYGGKEEMRQLDLAADVYANPEDRQRILALVNARDSAEYEVEVKKKDGSRVLTQCALTAVRDPLGAVTGYRGIIRDVTEQKKAEAERQAHLHFLEGMDKVNRAMQGTNELEAMMSAVLDTVLGIFDCDRAFLLFPCDPESPTWLVPMESTRPEYPGVLAQRLEMPMSPSVAESLRLLLSTDGPVSFGPGTAHPLPADACERFGFKSFMSMAIYPMVGKPWQFGVHQCSHARVWTAEEERLLREIGRRLADALGNLLAYRDLRESESRYRSLVTAMSEGVVFQGSDGAIISANPAAEKILGLPAAEMRGRTPAELNYRTITEDGGPFPAECHPAMVTLRTGEPRTNITMGILKESGSVTWISINSQPLVTPGTLRPYAVVTTFHDVTQRKEAADLVRQREREFRALAENLPANVARYDREGRFTYINRALTDFLGWPYEETISKLPLSRPGSEDGKQWLAGYRRTLHDVLATGERMELELDIPEKGAVHQIMFTPERDGAGEIVGALAIGRDITEYKRTQTRLQKQADELSEANNALKVLLQHTQQAETEIQKKCLDNIEALVLPYLDQLGSHLLSPDGRVCLEVIRKNLQGLAISSMSKLSSPVLGLTPREVQVADMIRKDYSSKDIADFLCLSPGTIEFYRDQIREKLGLKKQKINLKNYLRIHFND